ncbi:MAG: YIP1 family protein [Sphingomonadaceae bacterium]
MQEGPDLEAQREMQESVSPAEARTTQERFHPLDAAIGVLIHPVAAMRRIAAARPWAIALLLSMGIALLQALAGLTSPLPGTDANPELPPGTGDIPLQGLVEGIRSPVGIALQVLVATPVLLLLGTGVLYLLGRLLGGRGPFSALLSTLSFAEMPYVLLAPLTAWLNLAGSVFPFLGGLIGLGFSIWTMVLAVIGIRESLALSTGRAMATLLIPVLAIFVLATFLAILVAILTVGAFFSMQ